MFCFCHNPKRLASNRPVSFFLIFSVVKRCLLLTEVWKTEQLMRKHSFVEMGGAESTLWPKSSMQDFQDDAVTNMTPYDYFIRLHTWLRLFDYCCISVWFYHSYGVTEFFSRCWKFKLHWGRILGGVYKTIKPIW